MSSKVVDINAKVISAIKLYPILYKNNATMEERKTNWEKLAAEVGLPAPFLMTRWHYLRTRYQKLLQNNQLNEIHNFQFKQEMQFMLPFVNNTEKACVRLQEQSKDEIFEPEFIIGERDIVESDSDSEEYTFLEMDAVADKATESINCPWESESESQEIVNDQETELQTLCAEEPIDEETEMLEDEDELHIDLQEQQNESNPITECQDDEYFKAKTDIVKSNENKLEQIIMAVQHDSCLENKALTIIETTNIMSIDNHNSDVMALKSILENNIGNIELQPANDRLQNINEEIKEVCNQRANEEQVQNVVKNVSVELQQETLSTASSSYSQTDVISSKKRKANECLNDESEVKQTTEQVERCEDDIFGELVAAMLKRMPLERKRNVKKEIMNILL